MKLINVGREDEALLREVFLPEIQHVWFVWRQLLSSDLTHLSSTNALGEFGNSKHRSSAAPHSDVHALMCILCRELFASVLVE